MPDTLTVTLPGGALDPGQLQVLAEIADRYGTGTIEFDERSRLAICGLRDTDAIVDAAAGAGLRRPGTRPIVASPLSGRVDGRFDVRGLVRELDTAVRTTPELAALPDGFWFCLDDGRGDVAGLGADVGARVDGATARLLVGGHHTGLGVGVDDVVDALVGAAVRAAQKAYPAQLLDDAAHGDRAAAQPRPPVGWFEQDDGRIALGAAIPAGVLTAELARYVAAVERPVVVTPWRSLVIGDLDEGDADVVVRVLAPMGLIFDAEFSL